MTEPDDFSHVLAGCASAVERRLDDLLTERARAGEIVRPARLLAAMRHAVLTGGKRLRPFLVIETAAMLGGAPQAALEVAAALECVHCYSLVHDDLPAMDDDELRRGHPTVHKAYDEATAILAGDALLTLAFDILSDPVDAGTLSAESRLDLVRGLARAAGIGGMAGGQALDLQAAQAAPDEAGTIRLQAMKTGALIRYACEAGAIVGMASAEERERLAEFGSAIGLAFQLADDLLDLTASPAALGKATGKDAAAGKATLASLNGIDWTRSQLDGLVEQAEQMLAPWGQEARYLREAARFVATRRF